MIAFAKGYERLVSTAARSKKPPIHPAALAVLLMAATRPKGGRPRAFGPKLRADSVPDEPDPVLQRELDRALAGVRGTMRCREYVRLRATVAELFRMIDRLDLSDRDEDDGSRDAGEPAWTP
jgi:hypothetical protein